MELDPVCGMKVNREAAKAKVEHRGATYYFCCGGCAQRFTENPEKYILAAAAVKNVATPVTKVLPTPKPGGTSLPVLAAVPQEKDPVCGMMVDPGSPAGKVEYEGKTHFFCSTRCAERFKREPEKFLAAPDRAEMEPYAATNGAAGSAAVKVRYTCPMHPEIIQSGPGTCPKCGMALEPMDFVAEEQPDP